MKKNFLGQIIQDTRSTLGLTQDEFGARYEVSGPAIFKFEKGYARPSLDLWMRISVDANLSQRRAVLLWLKSKLPEKYQDYVELQSAAAAEKQKAYGKGAKKKGAIVDYSVFDERQDMRNRVEEDKTFPKGLRDLLDDNELWSLYKPTGHEINMLRDLFAPLGKGTKSSYREALRLIREFTHSF